MFNSIWKLALGGLVGGALTCGAWVNTAEATWGWGGQRGYSQGNYGYGGGYRGGYGGYHNHGSYYRGGHYYSPQSYNYYQPRYRSGYRGYPGYYGGGFRGGRSGISIRF